MRHLRQLILGVFLATAGASAREPFEPIGLWAWKYPEDPQISPDGARLAYVERWNDPASRSICSSLWLLSVDGRERRRLGAPAWAGAWRDHSPRWSPDSERLAWLSDRSGTAQLYFARAAAEQAEELKLGALEPESFAWSADGEWIAFTARATDGAGSMPWAPAELLPRLGGGWPKYKLLVTRARDGAPRELNIGDLWVEGEPGWVLDGKTVLISARNAPLGDSRIYAIDARAATNPLSPRALTHRPGTNFNPVASPEGSKIA